MELYNIIYIIGIISIVAAVLYLIAKFGPALLKVAFVIMAFGAIAYAAMFAYQGGYFHKASAAVIK